MVEFSTFKRDPPNFLECPVQNQTYGKGSVGAPKEAPKRVALDECCFTTKPSNSTQRLGTWQQTFKTHWCTKSPRGVQWYCNLVYNSLEP